MGTGRRRPGVNTIGRLCSRQVGVGRLLVILLVSVPYLRYIQFFLFEGTSHSDLPPY